ncbi:hypothetical protein PR002_g29211 [Phytophthora rubi]|uniref:Uncharacterized protein n=1 Tax=Phytophthora rubi TaxID=129364 RepID=A0A6A3H2Y8_9STRA|nr:hypothetical protein PR002_g29211 [Phytophthora rubi]
MQREQEQEQQGSRPRISQGPLQTPEQQEGGGQQRRSPPGVDVPAYAHYDAGETIGKLVTYPLRQLSAPTRVSEHPTPGHGTLVTLSDGQVAPLL